MVIIVIMGSYRENKACTDGKIIEVRQEADGLGLMLQLGMELKPKEGKENKYP